MRRMPTVQVSPRSLRAWRNISLVPYPTSASSTSKVTPAARTRSISSRAIRPLVRKTWRSAGTPDPGAPGRLVRPLLGEEQPQCDGQRHLPAGTCERDQALAVGVLTPAARVLVSH